MARVMSTADIPLDVCMVRSYTPHCYCCLHFNSTVYVNKDGVVVLGTQQVVLYDDVLCCRVQRA